MKLFLKMGVIALFFLHCYTVSGRNIYVSKKGNDRNKGTKEKPYKTVAKATSNAVAGDIVYIQAGVYTKGLTVQNSGEENKYIEFRTYEGDEHQVVFEGKGISIISKNYIKINGFRIQNADNGVKVEGPAHHIIIENNYTYNTFSSGIIAWGVPWQKDPMEYNNIQHLYIHNNKVEKACNGGWNECITLANGIRNFEVTNNEVFNGGDPINGGEGIDIKEGCQDGIVAYNYTHHLTRRGIYIDAGGVLGFAPPLMKNIKVFGNISRFNTHQKHQCHGMAVMTEGDGDVQDIEIYNNVFSDNNMDGLMIYKHPVGSGKLKNITIHQNLIFNNKRHGILINDRTSENIKVAHNIINQNELKEIALVSGEAEVNDNLLTSVSEKNQ
ncbi:DUF1565 domain-containing protein [Flammeovirga sp. MY04]|uniref:right-handed parallel beta-helix repeat-containing protein n=1 Tax=Flammeovirga sp. MY04 TaxID=1191459 RepID=UPI001305339D|nr:right-handed parallel beta-helix repeat-containing protein [Flammeovirga sp. MY04]ANQ47447.2 DUF1565 domain-containing protein [Flammeovirga sp. MY04]